MTRVGSGLSDAEWRHLREHLDAARLPEQPHQVEATITPDVWVEPRVVRIRDDRRPEDATTEAELLEMARLTNQVRRDTP